ncbi:uncharacterized protein LOC131545885 [Onychostoma macrolepis]|uniref:uncharacterized protein LOC131545885 n=1 Tax=Onychostoma macrolepis TaxID=369639 RepID=UPI00272B8278|nr:uncharacterized protein LOC131545885 [Onychostoma macrolepis]
MEKVTLAALATLNVKPQYCRICFASQKFEKWWIRSNGSTSIPEILKEFPRLLEKLGMMLKGRVLSKSCPLCFPNQYSRTEERSSDPQPQNPGSHSFDVQPVGTNTVMQSCAFCALVTRQRHPTPSPLFQATPLKRDAPVPVITVYQQMEDREHVIVMCSFGRRFIESSFQLSVDYEQNYTLKNPACITHEVCVFNITVRPPVSLTCIHEIITFGNESYLLSETYVLENHDGVSSFYIGFFSFVVVGVIVMTAAVIVTIIRSNAQDSNNDYVDV